MKSPAELRKTLATLKAASDRKKYRALDYFKPYPKQQEFLDYGLVKRERALMAGNQLGKTHCGAFEAACHLTGLYPDDWMGRTWDRPTRGWVASPTGLMTRDGAQKKLCGEPGVLELFGSGFIPRERFIGKPTKARGVAEAYDTVQIRHNSGGVSILKFKSYEQGREKFQSETLDWVWVDEEPPEEIYSEIMARIAATDGMVFCTFTPLLGRTAVVVKYIEEKSPYRVMVRMADTEVAHMTEEMRAKNRAGWKAHEIDARTKGIPMLGTGLVYEVPEAVYTIPPLEHIPAHWVKLWGIDFGLAGNFASVLILWDRDDDVIYVVWARKHMEEGAIYHAATMKAKAAAVPVAWPHDGHTKVKGDSSGRQLAEIYREHGLHMLPDHATHSTGGYAVEAGIKEILERKRSGRFKVTSDCLGYFEEVRGYHRKDGVIVKMYDHVMDACRTAVMMKRCAQAVAISAAPRRKRTQIIAEGVDFDVF